MISGNKSQPPVFHTNAVIKWLVNGTMCYSKQTLSKIGYVSYPLGRLYLCIKESQHS